MNEAAISIPTTEVGGHLQLSGFMLGTWPLSGNFENHQRQMGWGAVDQNDAIDTIRTAYENNIRWFDTADAYGDGTTSRLISRATKYYPRASYGISLKVGYNDRYGLDGNKSTNVLDAIDRSLGDLETDYVDLFSFHHLDFGTEGQFLDDTMELVSQLKKRGIIRRVGHRLAHTNTVVGNANEATSQAVLEKLRKLATDTIHAKMNIFCNPQHVDFVLRQACGRRLIINKPFAQGLAWRLLNEHKWEMSPGDHRLSRTEFSVELRSRKSEIVNRALQRLGLGPDALPVLALRFLQWEDVSSTIIFGAKSSDQVKEFLHTRMAADAIADMSINFQELGLWR